MTITIEKNDQEILEEAAGMLRAVAHPVRLAIVEMLDEGGRYNVTEIFERLGLEQAVTSHHLAILRDRGVLSQEREGKHVYYMLRHPRLTEIVHCVKDCCVV